MGTVGREKEASIHGFIEELHYQHGSLCIRITERLLVSQVGYGKEHQEFGLFHMPHANTGMPGKKCSKQELKVEKEKAAELLLRFVLFPDSQSCGNSVCINILKIDFFKLRKM